MQPPTFDARDNEDDKKEDEAMKGERGTILFKLSIKIN